MRIRRSPIRFTKGLWQQLRRRVAHPLFLVRVSGESMWPRLVPGRRYFATSLLSPRVGRIVVCAHPHEAGQLLVKRVERIADGKLHLGGTVDWSSSYVVPRAAVWGVIITTRFGF